HPQLLNQFHAPLRKRRLAAATSSNNQQHQATHDPSAANRRNRMKPPRLKFCARSHGLISWGSPPARVAIAPHTFTAIVSEAPRPAPSPINVLQPPTCSECVSST